MTAADAPLARVSFELEEPGPGQALVRVAGCGVCHTDLGFLYGGVRPRTELPLALGHEISGEVVAAGGGAEHFLGKAVVVPAVTPCGGCDLCRDGFGTLCVDQVMPGNDVQGGFATHVTVPAAGLCVVEDPAALAGETIGRSGCDLAQLSVLADAISTPYQALRRARVRAGDFVVVVGLGGVGGFAAQIAAALGATVVGFDVDPVRLERMADFGVDVALKADSAEPRALRKEVLSFAKAHGKSRVRWKIFECSGTRGGQELAWALLGPGAYLSVVGYTLDKLDVRLSNLMAYDAKAVGNWGCLPEFYPAALDLVLDGKVTVAPFVQCFPLDEIGSVLERVRAHQLDKRAVLVPRP
jgi:6-hydroxycyclohex-1-ene-1-carbonyl-CoA dehydrogenase